MAKEIELNEVEKAIKILEGKMALMEAKNDGLVMTVSEKQPGKFAIIDVRRENYDKGAKGNEKLNRLVR